MPKKVEKKEEVKPSAHVEIPKKADKKKAPVKKAVANKPVDKKSDAVDLEIIEPTKEPKKAKAPALEVGTMYGFGKSVGLVKSVDPFEVVAQIVRNGCVVDRPMEAKAKDAKPLSTENKVSLSGN